MKFSDLGLEAKPQSKEKKKAEITEEELSALQNSTDHSDVETVEAMAEVEKELGVRTPDLYDARKLAEKEEVAGRPVTKEDSPECVAFLKDVDAALAQYPEWGPDNLRRAFGICRDRFQHFFVRHTETADVYTAKDQAEAYKAQWHPPEEQVGDVADSSHG